MAWHKTGDKPLTEPIMTQFIDANALESPQSCTKPSLYNRLVCDSPIWEDPRGFPPWHDGSIEPHDEGRAVK